MQGNIKNCVFWPCDEKKLTKGHFTRRVKLVRETIKASSKIENSIRFFFGKK